MRSIDITAVGNPKGSGSKTAGITKSGKAFVRGAGKYERAWRHDVIDAALKVRPERLMIGPVSLTITFKMPRPKAHFRTGKHAHRLKDSAPVWHTQSPDVTKMIRNTEDALKGIIWRDDAQVCHVSAFKVWAAPGTFTGAIIRVQEMEQTKASKEIGDGQESDHD